MVFPQPTHRQDILRYVGHVVYILQDEFFILSILVLQTQGDSTDTFDWYLSTISDLNIVARVPSMYEVEERQVSDDINISSRVQQG